MLTTNPILPGVNPDPSICYANGWYYVAVSTFEFFPGVSIYKSKDLNSWSYVSSALDRVENLNLKDAKNSIGGIYAPTLRYNNGKFYMVTTNKNIGWNFIVHAPSIEGPWSDLKLVRKNGIDPSLFFEEDGRCYYTSNGIVDGVRGILGAWINPDTGELLSKEKILTEGVSKFNTEAPHIYKRDGWYYLMFAEGGTEYGHHEEIMRSRNIEGPYSEHSPKPILSHAARKDYMLQATGHADLIEREDGSWVGVFLGIRKPGKPFLHQLGRESFIAKVTWKDGWPSFGDDGWVDLPEDRKEDDFFIDFKKDLSKLPILKLREPNYENYIQDNNKGTMTLRGKGPIKESLASPTMLLVRQTEFDSEFIAKLSLEASIGATAGIAAFYSNDYHYALRVAVERDISTVSLYAMVHGLESIVNTIEIDNKERILELKIKTARDSYELYANNASLGTLSYAGLCTEAMMTMSFTGTLLGIFSEKGDALFLDGVSRRNI